MASALARELRENCGYLRDAGFQATARLMEFAASELERLDARVAELERRAHAPMRVPRHVGWRSAYLRVRAVIPPRLK